VTNVPGIFARPTSMLMQMHVLEISGITDTSPTRLITPAILEGRTICYFLKFL